MNDLYGLIDRLSSSQALFVLKVVSGRAREPLAPLMIDIDADAPKVLGGMLQTLEDGLDGAPPVSGPTIGQPELARLTLKLFAEDPRWAPLIRKLITEPIPHEAGQLFAAEAVLITALIVALQTHVKLQRTAEGRWIFSLEKKPTSQSLVASVIKPVLSKLGLS
jgi:hypothetical protein